MKPFLKKHHRLLFYGTWLLLGLIQAGTTQLFDDESYYWVYSRFPAWGYFDHPPMIAIMIRIGYALFHNEFGLRLLTVLMSTATIYMVQLLLQKKNDFLFYAIAGSMAAAQIGGFIAVPDIPLMFFVALYFICYRSYLHKQDARNILFLACSIALMMYSKYHGVLIVLFTLLSNPRLLRRGSAWMVVLLSLVLYLPHLYWQYTHDWVSVQYHLLERNKAHYEISYTLDYLLGQVLLPGPFLGWLFLWGAFRYRTQSPTEKALRYAMFGFYAFFLVSSLKAPVEANWTLPALVPLMVLAHQWLTTRPNWQKWVYRFLPVTLVVVLVGRVYMIYDFLPGIQIKKDEFHLNVANARVVESAAKGLPVVMLESFQGASKNWFYSGKPTFALNHASYRRNNYNFWPLEDSLIGKTVYAIGPDSTFFKEPVPAPRFKNRAGQVVQNYFSFSAIRFQHIRQVEDQLALPRVTCTILTPPRYLAYFRQPAYDTARIWIGIYNDKGKVQSSLPTNYTVAQITQEQQQVILRSSVPLSPGSYHAKLIVSSRIPGYPTLNSVGFDLRVEK